MTTTRYPQACERGPRRAGSLVLLAAAAIGCGTHDNAATGDGQNKGPNAQDAAVVTAGPIVVSAGAPRARTTSWSVNYWQWLSAGDELTGTEAQVAALAPTFIRIGGYNNDANSPEPFGDAQLDDAIAYARAIGAEPILQVPLLADTSGAPATASTAAAMVTYANVTKGYGVKYFSIGNEPDLYPVQGSLSDPSEPAIPGYTPAAYCASARAYVAAMKGVDPTIQIVGPDLSYHYVPNNDWLTPILQGCGDLFDVVSIHRYPFASAAATLANAASDGATFRSVVATVRGLMQAAGYADKPLALTEMNVAYDQLPTEGVPDAAPGTVGSALWLADGLGSAIQANLWTSAQWDTSDTDDWSLGLIGPAPMHAPRPEYYAYKLYATYFGPTLVDVISTPAGVSAYASRNQAGDETEVVVVNWNASPTPVAIRVTGLARSPAPAIYVLPATSIAAIAVPDAAASSASVYGPAQQSAGSGPQPLAPSHGVVGDAGADEAGGAQEAGADAAGTCPGVVPPSASITTMGTSTGASLSYGGAPDTWMTLLYAGAGQQPPTVSLTPDGAGLQISAPITSGAAAQNYAGVALYLASTSCVDAAAYTGVQFDFSGDLGGCALAVGVVSSDDLSPQQDPVRGACMGTPATCYGPQTPVGAGPGTLTFPFSAMSGGVPVATVDPTAIVAVFWQITQPSPWPDGGSCTANLAVSHVAFY